MTEEQKNNLLQHLHNEGLVPEAFNEIVLVAAYEGTDVA